MKHLTQILVIIFVGISLSAISQNIPNVELKSVEFKPSTFTPSVYTPIDNSSSLSILRESLYKQEQLQYSTGDKYVNFCKLLGDIYMKLYSDKDLFIWYDSYKKKVLSDISSNYEIGNYQTASRLIDERTAQILSDPYLLCRLDASEKYKAFKDLLSQNFNGSLIYQWWEDTHPFFYADKFDGNGNLIGYNSTELVLPLADFPWFDHMTYVRDRIISGGKYNHQIGGQIYDNFCTNNLGFDKAVEQSFQVTVWYYERELKNHPDSHFVLANKELLFDNDSLITPREYYIRRLSSWVK